MLLAVMVVVAGVIGGFAGSLINAAAVRLPAELDPIGPPICPHCSAMQPKRAMFPVWTGVCANCGASDHRIRWVTEAAATALSIAAIALYHLTFKGLGVAIFSLLLLLILRIDWQHHLIYTITIVPGIVLALALAMMRSPRVFLSASVAGIGAGLLFGFFFALALLIYRKEALGFGDILLAVLIGTMTGVRSILPALFVGMFLAAVGGLVLIAIGVRTRRDYIPYGAYLCAGTIIVLFVR
jgi:leader peptidase (prepilin peptidase)/N-methyltransferase